MKHATLPEGSPLISVCIPVRAGGDPYITLQSLAHQDVPFEVCIAHDADGRGANWARNKAARMARTGYLLFSDDDIEWAPGALRSLLDTLVATPSASYSYGAWRLVGGLRDGLVQCDRPFDGEALKRGNYISTMSLVRREHFGGFDEQLHRLQDWEMWLRMYVYRGMTGVYCGRQIFETAEREGITSSGPESYAEARSYVLRKLGPQFNAKVCRWDGAK